MALGYLGQVLLARWLGASGFGVYAFVAALVMFLAIPCQLGFAVLIVREASPGNAQTDPEGVRGLLQAAYASALGCAVALTTAGAIVAWLASPYPASTVLGLIALVPAVVVALNLGVGRAFGQVVAVKALQDIGRPGAMLLAAAAALALGWPSDSRLALGFFGLSMMAIAALQAARLLRVAPNALRTVTPRLVTRRWVGAAMPFVLIAVIDVLMRQTDLLMLGFFMPADAVGRYAAASRMATLVMLPLLGINMLAASAYADLYRARRIAAMRELAARLAHAMFWPALSVAVGLVVAGRWLLGWFGPGFEAAYAPMLILAFAGLIHVGAGSVGYLANMTGHQWPAVKIQGLAVGFNIMANAALIPIYGPLGAATGTLLCFVLANVALHIVVARKVGVRAAILYAGVPRFRSVEPDNLP